MFFAKTLKVMVSSRLSRMLVIASLFISQLMVVVIPATHPEVLQGQELGCLAMNIYQEGRSEPTKGKLAIAAVTMNRVASRHYPNTVCDVVWQSKQFSWTSLKSKYHLIKDNKAWLDSLALADLFLQGAIWQGIGNAKHYHNKAVKPNWRDKNRVVASIGGHIFYHL